ncbi:hypothetical protein L249_7820 [Ophiocordyceps polyrhachis-furcata BCC 54312]|uniref:Uncharacterized protein n=1 Tax=Ophiocordyceps polyrhachis-furcata BCC 54312 TaxID=1330021 RepID=A0A367L0Y2_9HYPO|nr:hypothetical protein L249_7820 [Ophiocordyceps polyrhachis-furcata BCC 54312]
MPQHNLSNIATQRIANDAYVLALKRSPLGIAAISSDQRLTLLDPRRLGGSASAWSAPTIHGNVTALAFPQSSSLAAADACTAGEDGSVVLWDLRRTLGPVLRLQASSSPILSMAWDENNVAVGTELHEHVASILLWDIRKAPTARAHYQEFHSDDITTLNFHPTSPDLLLSGSTDGLVNLYDTRIADEDDVTLQTLNHDASVHYAGFLSHDLVFALSHDERFSLYDGVALEPQDCTTTNTIPFGDLRASLDCQYVAGVTPKTDGTGAILGAGAQDRQAFELVFLTRDPSNQSWLLDSSNAVGLPGAHCEEIVRSFCFLDEEQLVFTAGEDGNVKAWRPNL